ncbi:MAG: cytochrome c [Colwellia sp.]|nr:cytochrome c [Colwellia sp.]
MNFCNVKNVVLASVIISSLIFSVANACCPEQGTAKTETAKEMDIAKLESDHIGNPESIKMGQTLYGSTCLFCHGSKGAGSRAPTLVKGGFKPNGNYDNEYFLNTIRFGRPGTIMGAFETMFTPTEMWQIMAYLRDQAKQVAQAKK